MNGVYVNIYSFIHYSVYLRAITSSLYISIHFEKLVETNIFCHWCGVIFEHFIPARRVFRL